jgi:hypothetical protein
MTMLNWSTFVLQRRVNQPFGAVGRVVCDPWLLAGGTQIALTGDAVLRLDVPFGVAFPVFGVDGASWSTRASIRSRRGHVLERIELDLNVWDEHATELLLRPCAHSPHHWRGRRMRRYFRLAHLAADALTGVLSTSTPRVEAPDRPPVHAGTTLE